MKYCYYAFGSTYPFFKNLHKQISEIDDSASCKYLFTSTQWMGRETDQNAAEDFIDLTAAIRSQQKLKVSDTSGPLVDKGSPGLISQVGEWRNIFYEIETSKFGLRTKSATDCESLLLGAERAVNEILQNVKPDVLVFAHPAEGPLCLLVARIAAELGIEVRIPASLRLLDRSILTNNVFELVATSKPPSPIATSQAIDFLLRFRSGQVAPRKVSPVKDFHPSAIRRFSSSLKTLRDERYFLDRHEIFRRSTWQFFPILGRLGEKIRGSYNQRMISKFVTELPDNFVYFPLQYSPEVSIHVPAPFFIDQLRLIDLIRLSLPPSYRLVVKEHPDAIGRRDWRFWARVSKRPGVTICDPKIDGASLIRRSALTISLTGTANLEAFLLGKPSWTIGPTFFSEFTNQPLQTVPPSTSPLDLRPYLETLIKSPPEESFIISSVANLFESSYSFICTAPDQDPEMMRERNIIAFAKAIRESLEDCKAPSTSSLKAFT